MDSPGLDELFKGSNTVAVYFDGIGGARIGSWIDKAIARAQEQEPQAGSHRASNLAWLDDVMSRLRVANADGDWQLKWCCALEGRRPSTSSNYSRTG